MRFDLACSGSLFFLSCAKLCSIKCQLWPYKQAVYGLHETRAVVFCFVDDQLIHVKYADFTYQADSESHIYFANPGSMPFRWN